MRVLRFIGKLLISLGVGVLLFVLWTLYGTGLYTARQQDNLSKQWEAAPEFHTTAPSDPGSPYRSPPDDYDPDPGDPVFRISIPKIHLNGDKGFMVVEGVGEEELKKGPGHYPACGPKFDQPLCTTFPEVWPGEKGRVVVSGHRTTYLHPFFHIDQLKRGDEIQIDTKWGDFTYEVIEQRAVLPDDPNIIIQKDDAAELVLTTCNPPYSASQRLITYARMVTT